MRRRHALQLGVSLGTALVAGCFGGGSSPTFATTGDDDTPIAVDASSLLLSTSTISETLGGEWHSSPEPHQESPITRSADATRGYAPIAEDGESRYAGWITASAWTFETVDDAREFYDSHGYQDGWGFEDRKVAVESIAGTVDRNDAAVLFRDANAMGAVARIDPNDSGDTIVRTALELAVAMHDPWREE